MYIQALLLEPISIDLFIQLPTDTIVLRHALSCLKAVSCALGPESLVPSVSQLSVMYNSSSTVYDPQPIPTARVVPSQDLRVFMREFATYQHDCYSYEKVWGPILLSLSPVCMCGLIPMLSTYAQNVSKVSYPGTQTHKMTSGFVRLQKALVRG